MAIASRSRGVDLTTGQGLAEALKGVDVVIDVSGVQTLSTKKAITFFTAATRNLLAAERDSGVMHHVALSIAGIDRGPSGLYAGKLAQEEAIRHGDVPWTLLRSTQFHEFVPMAAKVASLGPLVLAPRMLTQPVAAREVAAALVDAAETDPQERLPDLGGPRAEELPDLIRAYLKKTRQRKEVLSIKFPGPMGKAMRNGDLLPGPGSTLGRQTFLDWLEAAH